MTGSDQSQQFKDGMGGEEAEEKAKDAGNDQDHPPLSASLRPMIGPGTLHCLISTPGLPSGP
jgi:hypothetical protein